MVSYRQPFDGNYAISQYFGEKTTNPKGHTGIDYLLPVGTPVLASSYGTVMRTGYEPDGYGNYIIVLHPDGSGTVYAHLSVVKAVMGHAVAVGEVIGLSGNTGNSTGPHLHFEIRSQASKISTVIDPMLKLQCVLDTDPDNNTPAPAKREFEAIQSGFCEVVCDVPANCRCHKHPEVIITQKRKGQIVYISSEDTFFWNGYPYRKYFDMDEQCQLLIAEHDDDTQILHNVELSL